MSFYRTVLASALAVALVSPVFADDTMTTTGTDNNAAATTTTTTTTTEQTKIDVNKATVKQLTKKGGLTAKEARKIVAYRKKHGHFKSIDDLNSIDGLKLSPETQNRLTVE